MRSFTLLAICVAAVTAASNAGTIDKPIESQLSASCPLTKCYMEPAGKNKRNAPAVACSLGTSPPDSSLPQGCEQRCRPCRAEICTDVCLFEAFCESGPCPDAMAKKMSGSDPGSGDSCMAGADKA